MGVPIGQGVHWGYDLGQKHLTELWAVLILGVCSDRFVPDRRRRVSFG